MLLDYSMLQFRKLKLIQGPNMIYIESINLNKMCIKVQKAEGSSVYEENICLTEN